MTRGRVPILFRDFMTAPVNLNHARKARAKAARQAQAAQNRVTFGRTKAQKAAEALAKAKAERALDQARLSSPSGEAKSAHDRTA